MVLVLLPLRKAYGLCMKVGCLVCADLWATISLSVAFPIMHFIICLNCLLIPPSHKNVKEKNINLSCKKDTQVAISEPIDSVQVLTQHALKHANLKTRIQYLFFYKPDYLDTEQSNLDLNNKIKNI